MEFVKDRIEPITPICVSQQDILFALPVGSFMSTLFVRTYTPAEPPPIDASRLMPARLMPTSLMPVPIDAREARLMPVPIDARPS